ncbi:MAG: hypothetical protein Q9172_005021 [Xanthocarpia lactea]
MSSKELGVSLGVGIPLLVGVFAILRCAYRQRFVPRRQSDPEIGRERSAYAHARRPSYSSAQENQSHSQHRRPSTSSHVPNGRRREAVEDSRRPSNGDDAAQRSAQPQTQPARSRLTGGRVRIRSHPVTGLSGQELRAMDRGRLSTLSQPPSPVVEKSNRHGSASAPVATLVGTVAESSGNPQSDPRVSPIVPSTPASSRSQSTQRNSGSTNAQVVTPNLPAEDDAQDRHLHLRRRFESIPDDVDDMMSGRHIIPADGTSPQSPSELPHTTRRRRATDGSNRGDSQSGPKPRRGRNVTFNDNQNITYTIPPATSDSTSSMNAGSSSQSDDERPPHLPGTGLESPTVSPPLSENGIRLENITARNTAANRVRRSA